jgi:hypothetical protein
MIVLSKNIISGLAGAAVMNAVHQLAKKVDKDAPRIDKIGEEAVSKSNHVLGFDALKGNKLFLAALTGDVIANSIYYSLIGKGKRGNLLLRGIIYGAVAGIGALTLAKPLGLDERPVNKTVKTKAMTVGLYVLGGVATVLARRLLTRRP